MASSAGAHAFEWGCPAGIGGAGDGPAEPVSLGGVGRRRLIGILLVAISACGYGSGALLAKGVYATGTDWPTLLVWRFTLGGLLAVVWLLARPGGRAAFRRLTRRQAAVLVAVGMVFAGNAATYYAAIQRAPVSLVALLLYVYPAIVAVAATRYGGSFEGRRAWLALSIATSGAVFTVGGIRAATDPLGIALAVASPIIYSAYILLAARVAGARRPVIVDVRMDPGPTAVPPVLAAALMMAGTWLVLVTLAVILREPVLPWQVPSGAWPGLVAIAVFATTLAIGAFYAGVARVGAAQAALVSTLEPVFTVTLAVLLLGEGLGALQLAGGALVVVAVVLAQTGRTATLEVAVAREA
jgi:drug/metabolite transporter (DMT)-like permease